MQQGTAKPEPDSKVLIGTVETPGFIDASIKMLKCSVCGEMRPQMDFVVRSGRPRGFQSRCRTCLKAIKKSDYEKHKAERLKHRKNYYEVNKTVISLQRKSKSALPEVIATKRKYNQSYYKKNRVELLLNYSKEEKAEQRRAYNRAYNKRERKKITAQRKRRRQTDVAYDIECRMRSKLASIMKQCGARKSDATMRLVGCSREHLLAHLESQFLPGMSWDEREKWHIDHIVECARFDLKDPDQQRLCFHFSNLRPLWKEVNRERSAHVRRKKIA